MKYFSVRRLVGHLLAVSVLCAATFAQQSGSAQQSVDRLRQTITYLASDELEGRRTGTRGAIEAANYIAGEFKRLGLQTGQAAARGRNERPYLQPFPYVSNVDLGRNNRLFVNPGKADDMAQFMIGEDWMPLGFSTNALIRSAPVVFAGYGISSAELKYDDYAVSNAKDRVAIVFAGTPDGDNPHGQFAQAGQLRFKTAAARAAGARGLLIISDEEKLKDDRMSRLSYDNAGAAGIPVVVISPKLAHKLLTLGTLDDYRATADARAVDTNVKSDRPAATLVQIPRSLALRSSPVAPRVDLTVDVIRRESPSFNVVGILPGSNPKLKDEAIVIGAHYDHLGRGGEGSLAPREGDIHHGADDNASGVAGLLELARRLSSPQTPRPLRTIVFIAFSGEEEGLLGSDYYVNHPVVPLRNSVAMINMDMIGRLKDQKLIVGGVGTASEWRQMIQTDVFVPSALASLRVPSASKNAIKSPGLPMTARLDTDNFNLTLNEDGYGPSDHSSFYAKQVPVLFFWTGTHDDYHKPSDTADKINYEGEARIVSFVERIVRDIDKTDKRPTYTVAKSDSQGRSTGFRVYLGTIPNYADANDGLKLDGVRDDSPAAKAGLKAGDKVVKLAGREVKNVYDYTYALGEMKAGQEYEIEVMRDGQRLTMKITPEARK
jgi:Peptidase family M28/PDZ domain/PA domain